MRKIITGNKICVECGKEFKRPYGQGMKIWNKRRFCSHSCYSLNLKGKKGHACSKNTKKRISEANSGSGNGMYGKKTWNSGTKGTGICKGNKGSFKKGHKTWNSKRGKFKKCKQCKKEIWVQNCQLKRKKFCSRKCSNLYWEGREKINTRGENNWNWKNGKTPLRVIIWQSLKGKKWRKSIFERDNFTCQMPNCNNTDWTLNAHHIKEFAIIIKENNIKTLEDAIACEELWDIENGITLCEKCHRKIRSHEREYAPIFLKILQIA